MKIKQVLFSSIAIFSLASLAFAAEFAAPEKGGDANVSVSASEVRRNLYAVGANVVMNGKIIGDFIAAGGMVNIIGDVEADANIAAGSLSLSGKIGGDARAAGGNITISSPIGGDLLIGGGNISITEKSSIGGDLVIGGGNIVLDGQVWGMAKIAGGNITINGKIWGDVEIFASGGKKSGKVVFGPKAEVMGKIKHKGPSQAIVKDGAKISPIDYTLSTGRKNFGRALAGFLTLAFIIKLIAWFLAGLILIKYRKGVLQKIAHSIKEKPLENLGLGLAGLILIPIASILLLALLVGYYIAGVLALWYLLLLMLSGLISALFLGSWLMKMINKSESFIFDWKTLLLGVLVLAMLKFIPILGFLASSVVFLMSLGALLKMAKQKLAEEN